LSEISHFGSFQRVGGKAGGFISKKFFHPSSFRNQEKLWKAQTADEREQRQQMELEKRREEERQVEGLRKQMYLNGQGAGGSFTTPASETDASKAVSRKNSDQKTAFMEEKRRKAMLKQSDGDGAVQKETTRASSTELGETLARSRYPEDVHSFGHDSVWGSWYDAEASKWGYSCCKTLEYNAQCPVVEEHSTDTCADSRGTKRANDTASIDSVNNLSAASHGEGREHDTGVHEQQHKRLSVGMTTAATSNSGPILMDTRLLEAAQKRQNKKKLMRLLSNSRRQVGILLTFCRIPRAGDS